MFGVGSFYVSLRLLICCLCISCVYILSFSFSLSLSFSLFLSFSSPLSLYVPLASLLFLYPLPLKVGIYFYVQRTATAYDDALHVWQCVDERCESFTHDVL